MNNLIEWFARNRVAANLAAALILVAGLLAIPNINQLQLGARASAVSGSGPD